MCTSTVMFRSKRNQNNVLYQSISEFRVTKQFANNDGNQSTLHAVIELCKEWLVCEWLTCQSQWEVHFWLILAAVVHRCDIKSCGVGKGITDDGARVDLYQTAISLLLVPDDGVTEGIETDSSHRTSQCHGIAFAVV